MFALAVSGSQVYAAGQFATAGGLAASNIARWNGTAWSSLASGINGGAVLGGRPEPPFVGALALVGSDLFAGGSFTTAGGRVSPYIARAYLLPFPTLSVLRSGSGVEVSWPSADTAGFALEQTGTLAAPTSWVPNTASVSDDGTNKSVDLPARDRAQFFRLRRP